MTWSCWSFCIRGSCIICVVFFVPCKLDNESSAATALGNWRQMMWTASQGRGRLVQQGSDLVSMSALHASAAEVQCVKLLRGQGRLICCTNCKYAL